MNFKPIILPVSLSAIAITTVSACTANDTTIGGAVRQNYAAQVVNLDPEYENEQAMEGATAGAAVERYRTDKVKQPVGVKTTVRQRTSGGNGPN